MRIEASVPLNCPGPPWGHYLLDSNFSFQICIIQLFSRSLAFLPVPSNFAKASRLEWLRYCFTKFINDQVPSPSPAFRSFSHCLCGDAPSSACVVVISLITDGEKDSTYLVSLLMCKAFKTYPRSACVFFSRNLRNWALMG